LRKFFGRQGRLAAHVLVNRALDFPIAADRYNNAIGLRCWLLNLQSRAPSYLNPTGIEE
jgi:hypothetical protein